MKMESRGKASREPGANTRSRGRRGLLCLMSQMKVKAARGSPLVGPVSKRAASHLAWYIM